MNKIGLFAIAFCIVASLTRARECYYIISQMKCPYQCCGEEGDMKCIDSCDGVDCSSDEDCGDNACCSYGKCNDENTNCDSERYIPCSDDCPSGCCEYEYGVCQTRQGCFPQNANCSLNEDCASSCCQEGLCQPSDVCDSNYNGKQLVTGQPCSDDCPTRCCVYEYGICQTGFGCFPQNANCSLNVDCASSCCQEGLCQPADVCLNYDGEQSVSEHSEIHEGSTTATNIDWKVPVIVIAVVIGVALKIGLLLSWATRRSRSRVVIVRTAMAPTSSVQLNHQNTCDTVPFLSQDDEQIKHMQTVCHQQASA